MKTILYLDKFQKCADQLDKKILDEKKIETAVVMYNKDCVVLKLYKKYWANPFQDPVISESRIFFSIWISDSSIEQKKLLYNIHALKLRKLKGYSIQSRKFAEIFRNSFKEFEYKWKNVNIDLGPLTLMEGWVTIDDANLQDEILKLANNFLQIEHLIDETLVNFRKV